MNDLAREVQEELSAAAARRNAALDGVGYPDSPLWLALEAEICSYCGEPSRHAKLVEGRCPGCLITHPLDDSWRHEEADRKRMEMGRGWK